SNGQRASHAEMVEQVGDVVGMPCHSVRAGERVAPAPAAQVGGDDAVLGQRSRHRREGAMRRGDAVDGDDRGLGFAVGLPDAGVEAAGHVDLAVALAHRATHPPSMTYEAPVAIAPCGPARKQTSSARSSGSTNCLIADWASMILLITSSSGMP